MHCTEAHILIDDFLDHQLDSVRQECLLQHLDTCPDCQHELQQRRELLSRLRQLPVADPAPGYAARALQQAIQKFQHRRRIFLTGFGSALAASLALLAVLVTWQPAAEPRHPGIRTITLQVEQVQTVNLAFNVPERIDLVHFRLELPAGVSLTKRPGERQISWQDRLEAGRNLLRLPLIAKPGTAGELVARIVVDGEQKVFRIPLRTTAKGARHASGLPAIGLV